MTSSARSTFAPALKAGTQTFPPLRALIANMPPPPNAKLVAEGGLRPERSRDRRTGHATAFAISGRREGKSLIAEAERNNFQPAS